MEIHLSALKRQGVIATWHDRRIGAGKEFDSQISEHLESAHIILLLISPYFIASDYCYDIKMSRALERHRENAARVIPVILHPCDWKSLPFGKLNAVPKDGKPVSKYPNQHDAFLEVTLAIRDAAREAAQEFDGVESDAVAASPAESQTARGASPSSARTVTETRSSNLRVKKTFTQREKDKFEREAYEYIEKFFENCLSELERRNANVETEFRRVDANQFTAAAYVDGKEESSCTIRHDTGNYSLQGINYSYGRGSGSGMNESLSVEDDGYNLYLRAMGMNLPRSGNEQLSLEGAAEAYWELFMRQMPR